MKKKIRVSSVSPGRIRLRFDPEGEAGLNLQAFLEIPAIHEVTFRKLTGSLLILYDSGRINLAGLIQSIENKIPNWYIETLPETQFDTEYPHDIILGPYYHYTDRLDREIHEQTSGILDLRSAVVLIYLVWGAWEFLRTPVHPKWYDIIKEVTGFLRHYKRYYDA